MPQGVYIIKSVNSEVNNRAANPNKGPFLIKKIFGTGWYSQTQGIITENQDENFILTRLKYIIFSCTANSRHFLIHDAFINPVGLSQWKP